MSTAHEGREVAAAGRPPASHTANVSEPGSAVVPADPVLDGELVDDDRSRDRQQPPYPRPASWWQHSPRVPVALKSRTHATQAAKDAAVRVVCSPWWFVRATGRGTVLAARAWRRWVTVRNYREAAEQSEKLADKFIEIRELTLFRWRVTGAVAGAGTTGVAVAEIFYGPPRYGSQPWSGRPCWRSPGGAGTAALDAKPCSPGRAR